MDNFMNTVLVEWRDLRRRIADLDERLDNMEMNRVYLLNRATIAAHEVIAQMVEHMGEAVFDHDYDTEQDDVLTAPDADSDAETVIAEAHHAVTVDYTQLPRIVDTVFGEFDSFGEYGDGVDFRAIAQG